MAKLSGEGGAVSSAATDFAITNWEITTSEPILDVTDSSQSGWTQKLAKGIKNWTGTASGKFDTAATYPGLGTDTAMVFTRDTGSTLSGNAILGEVSHTVDVPGEEAVIINFSFEGNGALA